MRNKTLAALTLAAAIALPVAAQAQGYTTGAARGPAVILDDDAGIAVEQRPAFREYVIRERIPTYTIQEPVIVPVKPLQLDARMVAQQGFFS